MTLGFEINKVGNLLLVGVTSIADPLVEAGIDVVVERLNRDAYLKIVTGYEPRGPGCAIWHWSLLWRSMMTKRG